MTLLLLLFGTISDVFVVRATWPIVRYKNGTVGVKNDGGTVKVQSTDLIVDGNLSVSGSLFIQDRDLAEYEDRVSFLETALGDPALLKLSNCSSVTYRSPTAYPKEATEWDYLSIPSVVSGTTQFSLSWTDIKSICTHKGYILCSSETFCTNYVPPSALDIPEHDSWIAVGDSENEWLTFRRGWNNRICKTHTEVAGSEPSWRTSNFTGTTGDMYRAGLCCSVGDTSESMCTSNDNNTTTSVVSQLQSLTPPKCMRPGGTGLFFNGTSWICECLQNSTHVYHGASCENTCIQNATQIWNTTTSSCHERVQVTDLVCATIDGLGTYEMIGGKSMYVCNGYALLLAYNHAANADVVAVGYSTGVAPTSPVSSNAHIVANMIDKSIDDIESVKFFCNTTNHERIMNFRTENDKIRSAMVDGVYNPGCTFSCTSAGPDLSTGYTLLEGHTTRLPATTTRLHNTATSMNDFGIYWPMWNGGTCGNCYPSYGWTIGAIRGSGVWVDAIKDFQCDSESIGETDATSHQIWVKFKQ